MATKKQLRRRIRTLKTMVKAIEVDNYNLFCRIAELEQENERLKKAYDRVFKQHSDYVCSMIGLSGFSGLRAPRPDPIEPLPMRRWWQL